MLDGPYGTMCGPFREHSQTESNDPLAVRSEDNTQNI